VWQEKGPAYVQKLKQQSLAPDTLQAMHWRLNVAVGSTAESGTRSASTVLRFDLGSEADTKVQQFAFLPC